MRRFIAANTAKTYRTTAGLRCSLLSSIVSLWAPILLNICSFSLLCAANTAKTSNARWSSLVCHLFCRFSVLERRKKMGASDTETDKSALKEKKKLQALAPIAKPLAGKKLCKKTLKLVRKASESKCLKRGVKEVVKSIRRGNKGLCVIAGNISPIDVITHVPVLCEEADIPYVYVPSKEDLATAGATKRPTCCVLVLTKPTKGELTQEEQEKLKGDYAQVVSDVSELAATIY